jgi:pimeloyl-ACP methyl ester carboxylesterase
MSPSGAVVLIPGAGGDPWYWHRVVDELERRGRPGDATEVVLVGQSLGGFSAVLACDRLSVTRLMLVNAMIPNPGETPDEWWRNTGQPAAKAELDVRDGRDPDADFDVMTYFLHDLPVDVLAESAAHAREQAARPFGTAAAFDGWPDVPTHVIVGRDDRFFPAAFQRALAQERLGLAVDEVPGGHLVALSHPVELVDQLEAYLSSGA